SVTVATSAEGTGEGGGVFSAGDAATATAVVAAGRPDVCLIMAMTTRSDTPRFRSSRISAAVSLKLGLECSTNARMTFSSTLAWESFTTPSNFSGNETADSEGGAPGAAGGTYSRAARPFAEKTN